MREAKPTFSNSGSNGRISCNILYNTVLYDKTQPVGTPLFYEHIYIYPHFQLITAIKDSITKSAPQRMTIFLHFSRSFK